MKGLPSLFFRTQAKMDDFMDLQDPRDVLSNTIEAFKMIVKRKRLMSNVPEA
jgi:hypothetical protein